MSKKKKKYYVVWEGNNMGIFNSWDECKLQTKNYKGELESLPFVYGKNANKNFSLFYKVLQDSNFDINTVDYFKYFEADRWDIFLKKSLN